jgi:metal-responsive CopG/Arc/MetJ family transcriptional regulator
MEPDKNLHAKIPPELLTEMEKAAQEEHITPEELVRDAVERRLNKRQWQDGVAFGEKHAKSRGLTETDVPEAIAEVCGESHERRR